MDTSVLTRIAKSMAAARGLAPELVAAVCEHESSWDPWAERYEPAFFLKYVVPIKNLSPTEAHSRSTSYGLMQIMGQVAREEGFEGKYLTQLCDPITGLEYGCKKLAKCLQLAGGEESGALLKFNGGADPSYAAAVLALVEKYK